jgi:hypothetical protein
MCSTTAPSEGSARMAFLRAGSSFARKVSV